MKLNVRKMIREEIKKILEAEGLEEKDIQALIDEYYILEAKIKEIEAPILATMRDIKTMGDKQAKLTKVVTEWMVENKKDMITTSKWVAKIAMVLKYKKPTPEYKMLWEYALSKVNGIIEAALRKFFDAHLDAKSKETKPELNITPLTESTNDKIATISEFGKIEKELNKELHKAVSELPEIPNDLTETSTDINEARSIGKRNIDKLIAIVKQMYAKNKSVTEDEILEVLPQEWWDIWESADSEIRRITSDILVKLTYGHDLTEDITNGDGKYRAEVTGIREKHWSSNAVTYNTPEKAKEWLDNLSMRWTGYDMSRVVPESTPKNQIVDMQNDDIYQNFRK